MTYLRLLGFVCALQYLCVSSNYLSMVHAVFHRKKHLDQQSLYTQLNVICCECSSAVISLNGSLLCTSSTETGKKLSVLKLQHVLFPIKCCNRGTFIIITVEPNLVSRNNTSLFQPKSYFFTLLYFYFYGIITVAVIYSIFQIFSIETNKSKFLKAKTGKKNFEQ